MRGLTRGDKEHDEAISVLEKLTKSTDSVIAESAQWAMARIHMRAVCRVFLAWLKPCAYI